MDAETYWKFCTLLGRIDATIARAVAAKAQLFADHGLDPSKNYDINDEHCTITEQPKNG